MLHRLAWPHLFRLMLVLAVAGVAVPAPSAESEVFSVRGVVVDARAADELSAKSAGIAGAQRDALRVLLERIILREDYDRLPEVAANALPQLVRNYSVDDEKFGGGRYLARLTVRFKPGGIRALLGAAEIPFAVTVSRPVLVLPVFRSAGATSLWDEPNPWFAAWSELALQDDLLPLIVPAGNLSDVAVIGAEQAVRGNRDRLAKIAAKYNVRGVLVIAATLRVNPGDGALLLAVASAAYGYERDQPVGIRNFKAAAGDSRDAMFRDAARSIADEAVESWKRANLLDQASELRMRVAVPLRGLDEWLKFRRRIGAVASIKRVDLARLSIDAAEVEILYIGNSGQLALAMAQSGLALKFVPGSALWILRIVEGR